MIRVPGKADKYGLTDIGSIYLRLAPIDVGKSPNIALKFKDEPRVLFRASVDSKSMPDRGDFLRHPSLGTEYEVLSVEDSPNGESVVKYLIVAQVIE